MTDKKLTVTTIVPAPAGDGESHYLFGPDSDVPDWALPFIGAHCWEGGVHPGDTDGDGEVDRAAGQEPPRGGPGSNRDAWAAFSAERGVPVVDGASRDQIVQALVDAGQITA